jgi:hypothetical protein
LFSQTHKNIYKKRRRKKKSKEGRRGRVGGRKEGRKKREYAEIILKRKNMC